MQRIILDLENLIKKNFDKTDLYQRNILKDYLQILVLRYIYEHKEYSQMIFYGGSALAHCYGLPRLSEDLDFVDARRKIKLEKLAEDLEKYLSKNFDLPVKTKIQKFRIYLKFPILKQLGLANSSQSDWLYLKLEIFTGFSFCKKYKTEIKPIFKFNQPVLINTFDLPTLMATKIRAILYRKWEKTDKTGKILLQAKGRDYFDLMWYLQQGVSPNLACIEGFSDKAELKKEILRVVKKLDGRSVTLDLQNFMADKNFVKKLAKNLKEILTTGINKI